MADITKAASLAPQEVTEAELKEINKYTLEPLKAEEVFTFSSILCDTEVDRTFEHFTPDTVRGYAELFKGRTLIKDHDRRSDNQIARIYSTEVVETGAKTQTGDPYLMLKAKAYMVKTESNADLIKEIKAGIRKEGSVGVRINHAFCSICGVDNTKTYCRHWPGRAYDTENGEKKTCTFKLDGAADAYEFSLVAVPAQRAAGTTKNYTGKAEAAPADEPCTPDGSEEKLHELELRRRRANI